MLSIDVLYVTIADAVKIAQFFQFLQGYSLWFFFTGNSRPLSRATTVWQLIAFCEKSRLSWSGQKSIEKWLV
jgi:hypothetical protein